MKKLLLTILVLFSIAFGAAAQSATANIETLGATFSTNRWFTNGTTTFSVSSAFYVDLGTDVTKVKSLYFNPRFVSTNTTTSNMVFNLQSSPDGVVWVPFYSVTNALLSTSVTNAQLALFRTNGLPVSANRYIRLASVINGNGATTNIAVTNLTMYGIRERP